MMQNDCCPMGYDCSLMTGYSFEFCHNRKVCQEVAITIPHSECCNDVPNPFDWQEIAVTTERGDRHQYLYQLGYQHGLAAIGEDAKNV